MLIFRSENSAIISQGVSIGLGKVWAIIVTYNCILGFIGSRYKAQKSCIEPVGRVVSNCLIHLDRKSRDPIALNRAVPILGCVSDSYLKSFSDPIPEWV